MVYEKLCRHFRNQLLHYFPSLSRYVRSASILNKNLFCEVEWKNPLVVYRSLHKSSPCKNNVKANVGTVKFNIGKVKNYTRTVNQKVEIYYDYK